MNLYNGEVIAFTIGDKQDTDFVLDTLDQLPTLPENCVLYSDQGSVYTSYEYQKAVKTKGITMSMSRKEKLADNASIESFHSSVKSETFYLNSIDRTTTAIVERTVIKYIHYYNNIRIQTKLNNQSPISYRQLALKGVLIPVSKTGVSPYWVELFSFNILHSRRSSQRLHTPFHLYDENSLMRSYFESCLNKSSQFFL
ncbi:integrase catalytic subunit [Bacillus subtilis]|nr:hypothetical protein NRS6185_01518 [Bacillus subtilis]SNY73069.1 Transposase and inactivated derivatives [Bacillus subtilis]SPY20916.1 integrase catalytic subunit [Bacillus subtilis]